MLRELSIRDFAIIDDLRIEFSPGLTIMSGETGAGKSIILNAVNLLLGSRPSAALVRSGARAAELEALFDIDPEGPTAAAMEELGYDPAEGLLVRRLIAAGEGNRVYINGRLATVQALTAITARLASISGQHAHQQLLRVEEHLNLLDRVAGLWPLRAEVARLHGELLPLIAELDALTEARDRGRERRELLAFQHQEIAAAAAQPGEDTELEAERRRLKHAEELYESVYRAVETLYGAQGSVSEQMAAVRAQLGKSAEIDPALGPPAEALADLSYQVEDLAGELRSYLAGVEVDERRLEAVEERLDTLNRLKRKYGGTLAEVLARQAQIETELAAAEGIGARVAEAEAAVADKRAELAAAARKLSEGRQKAAGRLGRRVERELASLKMAGTAFQVALAPVAAEARADRRLVDDGRLLTAAGIDRAEFMFSPNVGEALKPLAAIASGGELSRVVLALKCLLAGQDAVQTLVFDEVDAGIGGATAEVVGRKLSELARHHQVICITHLPQIAKFADVHLHIAKQVSDGRTTTRLRRLEGDQRRQEIARMLGGEQITTATLEHAREILGERE